MVLSLQKKLRGGLNLTFFDINPEEFQEDSQYFFNVMVIYFAVNKSLKDELLNGENKIVYLEKITSFRPYIVIAAVEDDIEEDIDGEVEYYPHSVVEITKDKDVDWWSMLDFETDYGWRIE